MTGKELIAYILSNNLENTIFDYITKDQFAMLNKVGLSTVDAWCLMGRVPFITIGTKVYLPNKSIAKIQKERKNVENLNGADGCHDNRGVQRTENRRKDARHADY